MDAQLKKGFVEVAVLAILNQHDSYGYSIMQELGEVMEISESTLYPILKRLESQGCLKTYSVEHNSRLRKYYRITPEGTDRIREFLESWNMVEGLHAFIRRGYRHG